MKTRSTCGSGNGRDGPCDEARRLLDLGGRRDLGLGRTRGTGDLRRVRPAVARDQRDDPAAAAVEDERLDDLAELAADGACCVVCGRRSLA